MCAHVIPLPLETVGNSAVTASTTTMLFVIQIELTTNLEMGGSLVEPMDPPTCKDLKRCQIDHKNVVHFFPFHLYVVYAQNYIMHKLCQKVELCVDILVTNDPQKPKRPHCGPLGIVWRGLKLLIDVYIINCRKLYK